MTSFERYAVIMAGGSGERFWPLSRRQRPKQILRLTSERQTLLEEAIGRIAPLIPGERIFIATARSLVEPIRAALPGIPPENVLGEPCKRNTAGCLAWAAAHLAARSNDPARPMTMAVLTADHRIGEAERFQATCEAALAAAERHDALVTIGIRPTRPETGYGYIETAAYSEPVDAIPGAVPVFPVVRFREKPDRTAADEFVASGRFFWNSGMFFWPIPAFRRELTGASPAIAAALGDMAEALTAGRPEAAENIFEQLPDISIDYALMEKAGRVLVARGDFSWDDVGAWDALDRVRPHDESGNVTFGEPILIDTRNSIVYNEPGAESMAVAVIGVEDLAVVTTADGILVMPKDRAQDVKQVVATLRQRGESHL